MPIATTPSRNTLACSRAIPPVPLSIEATAA